MFFFGPELMLEGSASAIVVAAVSVFIGTGCVAACVVGYLNGPHSIWLRMGCAAAGISLLHSGVPTDVLGLAVLAVVVFSSRKTVRQ
jgi:TRAP-type uncharacterized transport system fused permease subunit